MVKQLINLGRKITGDIDINDKIKSNKNFIDNVNHPSHYNKNKSGIECMDVVEHMTFNKGNAIKYIWRSGEKDKSKEIEDLKKKAIWYLGREIKLIEKGGN